MKEVRVRFAPSPTGFMHLGNARTALFNWLFARKENGKFILRIEDTDQERSTEEATEMITRDLTWLQLTWDEGFDKGGEYGPYRQSDRQVIYQEHLKKLEDKGAIYPCYCTNIELDMLRQEQLKQGKMPRYDNRCRHINDAQKKKYQDEGRSFVWRFAVPDEQIIVQDLIRGDVAFDYKTIGDFVLTKSTGGTTFNFSVSIDDACMQISHVIRGEDHLTNTARHVLLFDALDYERPLFAHMPMILGESGAKLSKRNGLVSLDDYRRQGFLPEALVNYMSFLGWSPYKDQETEFFLLGELSKLFDLKRLSKSPATFDVTKLKWVNSYYLRHMDLDRLSNISLPILKEAKLIEEDLDEAEFAYVIDVVDALKGNLECLEDLPALATIYFKDNLTYDTEEIKDILSKREVKDVLISFKEQLNHSNDLADETIKALLKAVSKETGKKGKAIYLPLRVALSAQLDGVEIYKMIRLVGKERAITRLNKAILV